MFVRTLDEMRAEGREKLLADGKVRSVKMVTAEHDMGFSMSHNTIQAGAETVLWYKNHWEANYILSGTGAVTDLTSGQSWPLVRGTLNTVGPGDRHLVAVTEEARILSIFNPPLTGEERHDEDGAYPPTGPVPPGRARMFVRTVEAMRAAGREKVVSGGAARTLRMLLKEDGVGFTLSDVHKAAGNESVLWYKNHWEANYILSGTGEVTDLSTGESWALEAGVLYCVGPRDRHRMGAETDLHLISVFSPPLVGDETHDQDGAYPPTGPVPPGPKDP